MDYLNYALKPKKWKTEPFGNSAQSTNKEETSNNFSFGNLAGSNSPPPPTAPKPEIVSLFATPILICPGPSNYDKELKWIREHEFDKTNKVPQVDRNTESLSRYNRQSIDTFILDKPELANIRLFIERNLNEYVTQIMGSNSKLIITQSWLNKSGKGEFHHEHYHPNSIISGVWYPQIDEKLPPIQFSKLEKRDISLPISQHNNFNSTTFRFPLKQGELIIFPSNLSHSVPINNFERERISLSFNTWTKGNMGNIESLTYLPIDRCV